MIARPSTMPTVAPNACRVRARMIPVIDVAASAAKLDHRQREAGEHHRPASEPVGQRAEHELRDRHAEQEQRERELHGAGARAERDDQCGHRGRQDIERERADRGRADQQREQAPGMFIGMD